MVPATTQRPTPCDLDAEAKLEGDVLDGFSAVLAAL
jgi:hypothetical protein